MTRVVIVGGFAEGERLLNPVAEACKNLKLTDEDPVVFSFAQAMDSPDRVIRASRGQAILTHSAGILAVNSECRPRTLDAYNGPEKSNVVRLVKTAITKTFNSNIFVGNTLELMRRPWGNFRHLGRIAAFSTTELLLGIVEQGGIEAHLIAMDKDEFFLPNPDVFRAAREQGLRITELPGLHDDLLVDPIRVLASVHGVAAQ